MPGAAWWSGSLEGPVSRGAVGHAVLEPRIEPLTYGTPFDLASLTKPLSTAILAVLLEREGKLALTDACSRWLPELSAGPYASVPLADLGAHRGGLPAWRPIYLDAEGRDGYVERIAKEAPAGPSDGTLYSDLSYILLGVAIERAAGETLDALFDRLVAGPLGLERTGYAVRGSGFADAAATERGNAYERRMAGKSGARFPWRTEVLRGEVHDVNAWALSGVAGHAGLFAPVEEVVSIASAVLDPLRLGLPGAEAIPWTVPAEPGKRTFGWMPARDADSVRGILDPDAFGHFGFTGTSVWIEPGRRAVHVLLTNRVHPDVPPEPFTEVRRGFHAAVVASRAV
jgi:CubicO group peptidase (beta-lactamase class C family)